ncbi:MAG: hypothetical protein IPM12_08580 [Flavobacteriales bacterium]|nr:hypothetical protein [Flavobacteriales bacterium]
MKHARISLLTLVVLALSITRSQAQNLVPNGSFEEYTQCPDFWNQMSRATGWSRFHRSPDYFNACLVNGLPGGGMAGVPGNVAGWQIAATGQGYAGGYLWCEPVEDIVNIREHSGAMLAEPLQIGVPVYLSFKVSVAANGSLENARWSASGAGMRFSMNPYLQDWPPVVPNAAAIHMDFVPTDTTVWYEVTGTYVPDSAYQYVTLGNFFDDANTAVTQINPGGNLDCAYVFYDDVCVSYVENGCGFQSGLSEPLSGESIRATLSFSTQVLTLVCTMQSGEPLWLSLLDVLGRAIWDERLTPGSDPWLAVLPSVTDGIYQLKVQTMSGDIVPVKLFRTP